MTIIIIIIIIIMYQLLTQRMTTVSRWAKLLSVYAIVDVRRCRLLRRHEMFFFNISEIAEASNLKI